MPIPRWLAISVAVMAVCVMVGACSQGIPSVPTSASPGTSPSAATSSPQPSAPAGPLLTVETQGGDCAGGACGSTIVIEADGRVHATAPAATELGVVPAPTFEGLITEIAQADFAALKSRPFTDTCPIAFDGQKTIYTFATASGIELIDSCEVVVDPADPLFVAVSAVLAAIPAS
jgi:hypothetical protein